MKNILISLCLALFIISASVTITLNFRPLYYHDISSLQIEETSGFSKKVIRENYDALIDYNQFFYSGKLKLTLPMSREGKIHFEEVKRIFCWYRISLRDHTDLILFPHKEKNKVTKY